MSTVATRWDPAPTNPLAPVERDTVPKIFFSAIDRFDRPDAIRYKKAGEWRTLSHREVEARASRLAAALEAGGVRRGDRVAILSENRPEWAISDYAILGMGAVDVPIYPTLLPKQIAYILRDSGAKAVLLSTAEQVEKIVRIRDELPELERVIAFDGGEREPGVETFAEVLEAGRRALEQGRAEDLRRRAGSVGPDDLATLIYTSGTTGDAKGVMLTHFNLASNVAASQQHGSANAEPGEIAFSFLPLSHVFERMVDYSYWDLGVGIAYAGSMETVITDMAEVRPHLVVSVPRLFDRIYATVMGATGFKRALVLWAKRVGEAVADERFQGREPTGGLAFRYRIADRIVFSKIRAVTGGRVRAFISGGAPLSPEVAKFFFAAGIPLYEGYGLTETSPVVSANTEARNRLGTTGTIYPGTEVRIAADGEVLVRGPQVMKGYWNRPEATRGAIDADGWFHTGDIGEIDEGGFLKITDRKKNLIVTAGGKNIAPAPIENEAATSPYVAQAIMIGDRRPYPILIVVPDFEMLEAWAAQQGIDAADRERLVRDSRARTLLERDVFSRLTDFARYQMPKKLIIAASPLSIESGTLTPKLSVRRFVVEERFRDRIEVLYRED